MSQLGAYGSGVVMRLSSDNSSLMFAGFDAYRGLGPPLLYSGGTALQGISNQGSFCHALMPISQYKWLRTCFLQTRDDGLRM